MERDVTIIGEDGKPEIIQGVPDNFSDLAVQKKFNPNYVPSGMQITGDAVKSAASGASEHLSGMLDNANAAMQKFTPVGTIKNIGNFITKKLGGEGLPEDTGIPSYGYEPQTGAGKWAKPIAGGVVDALPFQPNKMGAVMGGLSGAGGEAGKEINPKGSRMGEFLGSILPYILQGGKNALMQPKGSQEIKNLMAGSTADDIVIGQERAAEAAKRGLTMLPAQSLPGDSGLVGETRRLVNTEAGRTSGLSATLGQQARDLPGYEQRMKNEATTQYATGIGEIPDPIEVARTVANVQNAAGRKGLYPGTGEASTIAKEVKEAEGLFPSTPTPSGPRMVGNFKVTPKAPPPPKRPADAREISTHADAIAARADTLMPGVTPARGDIAEQLTNLAKQTAPGIAKGDELVMQRKDTIKDIGRLDGALQSAGNGTANGIPRSPRLSVNVLQMLRNTLVGKSDRTMAEMLNDPTFQKIMEGMSASRKQEIAKSLVRGGNVAAQKDLE